MHVKYFEIIQNNMLPTKGPDAEFSTIYCGPFTYKLLTKVAHHGYFSLYNMYKLTHLRAAVTRKRVNSYTHAMYLFNLHKA
jgi:hypothetical protein